MGHKIDIRDSRLTESEAQLLLQIARRLEQEYRSPQDGL